MLPEVERWRADTPGCANVIHFNNAGASLMPQPVLSAMIDHLHREANFGGYESADDAGAAVNHSYASVARLIGAEPKNIAVVENATVAFFQALSAFDFREGDIIVTTRNDYISNQLAYLSLAKRHRVVIERAADLPSGGVDPQSVRGDPDGGLPCDESRRYRWDSKAAHRARHGRTSSRLTFFRSLPRVS